MKKIEYRCFGTLNYTGYCRKDKLSFLLKALLQLNITIETIIEEEPPPEIAQSQSLLKLGYYLP